MKRGWQWAAVLLSTAAVMWMLAPTFPMVWAPGPDTTMTTWHSWADPLVFGYLILPPVILLAVVVAAVVGWYQLARRRATWAPVVCCGIAGGLLVILYSMIGLHLATIVPAVAMVASAVLHALARRRRLTEDRGGEVSRKREVSLRGLLVCADEDQWQIVVEHLPLHIALTRAEPGCLWFEVTPKDGSLVWEVSEGFRDRTAFRAHQDRVAGSAWGRATAGIERRYIVE